MRDLLLAVNIGNTTIECGIFAGDELLTAWRLSSEVVRMPDECWQSTTFFCKDAGIKPDSLGYVAIGSVVPDHTQSFAAMASSRVKREPLVISIDSCPFLKVDYDDPRQVGADRLCNGFAGYHFHGGPLIVVDFGTAVTLDVVSGEGAYMGGIILPGPLTAAAALHSRTARLPRVSLNFPERVIGRTTSHSIQSGLTWGIVDMVDGLIGRVEGEMPVAPKVVATGGFAESYAERSRNFRELHTNLVLEGVRLIHEHAQEK